MNSWQKVEFKDFITLQRGFDLPVDNIVEGDVPVFGSNTIIGYHNVYKVEGPGVITGRSGTLGIVQYAEGPFWPHNTSLWVKDFKGNVPKFVYYKLKTLNLNQFSSGASVPTLNRNNLDNISILIPRNKAQKRIADLLSVYDDLIDNNRKRIDLLEESARELYKEWFVRLRFPGYEKTKIVNGVPEGWERKKLRDVIELRYGKSLKEENRSDGPYPVYGSSGEIGRHRDFLVEGPGIIVGRKGNAGTVFWSHENFFPIDTTYYIMNSQSD
ncbi:MAG: restriction endonuclease subunit S, partial [Bacteroidetes bacterium]